MTVERAQSDAVNRQPRRALYLISAAALFLPAAWIATSCYLAKDRQPIDDEIYWIGSAYYFHLAFIERDLTHSDWQLLPARENPPVGKYLIGASLRLMGEQISNPDLLGCFYLLFARVPGAWGTGEDFEKRARVASRVDPAVAVELLDRGLIPLHRRALTTSRAVMGVFAILTSGAIILIGRLCNSSAGGFAAAFIFVIHPIVAAAYCTALIDIAAVCFSTFCILGYIAIVQHAWKRASRSLLIQAALVLFTGLMLASACGTKMNSLIVAAVGVTIVVFHAVRWHRTRCSQDARSMMLLLSSAAIAVGAFLVVNPTLYPNVVDGIAAMFYEHQLTASVQERLMGGHLSTVSARVIPLAQLLGVHPVLFGAIILAMAVQVRICWRHSSVIWLVIAWWLIGYIMLLLWLPFAWDRYALPLAAPTSLILGKTCVDCAALLRRRSS